MTKSIFVSGAAVLALLCGCANPGAAPPPPLQLKQPASVWYSCSTHEAFGPQHDARMVRVDSTPALPTVRLVFEHDRIEILDPVAQGAGLLFANAAFAWRAGPGQSVLTDIANIQTYTCIPGAAPAFSTYTVPQ